MSEQGGEMGPLGEHFMALAGDVLPDGRVDHRGHQRDDQGGFGWVCADCSGEDEPGWIDWTIPYDIEGRPIPEDWRTMPYATVLALCGMTRPVPTGRPPA